MKKEEYKHEPAGGAFSRMSYLFQAAHLMSKISPKSPLSSYYGKTVKEISKKIVEKLHPDMKRTLCTACNCPLTSETGLINTKVKPNQRKRRKIKKKKKKIKHDLSNMTECENSEEKCERLYKRKDCSSCVNKYTRSRIEVKKRKPNRVLWSCCKCGFSKSYLQQPDYKIWIHKMFETECSPGPVGEGSK